MVTTTVGTLSLLCPRCRRPLGEGDESYYCGPDGLSFPVRNGIVDLRRTDASTEPAEVRGEDEEAAGRLMDSYSCLTFRELLRLYYELDRDTPADLIRRYIALTESAVPRAGAALAELERETHSPLRRPHRAFLEIGCGNGGFLVAAADESYGQVAGLDIDMSALVLASKRMEEAGVNALLVCASAAELPFADGSFQLVVARDVLEHVDAPTRIIQEAYRVLDAGGVFFAATPNRWSLGLEPHVRVWGVGFLPRAWRERYVRLVRKASYGDVNTLNYFDVRRLLTRSAFSGWRISLPSFGNAHRSGMTSWERRLVPVYETVRRTPLLGGLVRLFGPLFNITCTKGPANA